MSVCLSNAMTLTLIPVNRCHAGTIQVEFDGEGHKLKFNVAVGEICRIQTFCPAVIYMLQKARSTKIGSELKTVNKKQRGRCDLE